ncbi:DNA mismatch repair protein MutL [Bacillus coahuilensis m2-6]|uniref:DNA mismatch repair endonuclease MutL n=1 Tax=Bacillus coahuilensis TaxID=408580 RepID=UPI0007505763|nr:DNA mismatch repair endonuclease MutL [Bacillus coahuilensis]KUP08347.1 DNA mismatch repair protein MutL [Bacillus coahuilensis m2-6]
MGKIVLLDDSLSNKIAAGEVVERPASVVKELVENSIDAKATRIEVFLEEAGLSKIRIVDNGDGIEEDDVKKAFHRHATSKIKDENDLFRIRTLGFRGEAIPSIASVSIVEMSSSTGDGPGTYIKLEGGKIVEEEKGPSRKGTDITVSNLFFNTPARLKYVKTIHTELGNITDTINRLALSHPSIAFILRHNERTLLQTAGNGDVRQVLASIYGMNIAKKMLPVSVDSLDYSVRGHIALPEVTRASRNYISTMINGRFIKNYGLVKAIQEGYHTLLPIGRFPIVLLTIEMDPILVDVNVHPSKMEVRLSKEQELYEVITTMIKDTFKNQQLIPSAYNAPKLEKEKSEQGEFELDPFTKEIESSDLPFINTNQHLENTYIKNEVDSSYLSNPQRNHVIKEEGNRHVSQWETTKETKDSHDTTNHTLVEQVVTNQQAVVKEKREANPESRVPVMYPIGQMHGTYILAQNENGLYLIDQHAAQERIKYEFFREKVGVVDRELQELLVPFTFEFSTDETMKIEEHLEELKKVGVFLEPFGQNSFISSSHPQWLPRGEEKEVMEEMIEQLLSMKRVDVKKLREEAAIMMSCKGSIKANHHLRQDEIQSLLDELRQSEDPFTCPHGRPIIVHLTTYELEKMFKRVM